jgi:squalene-hopene/tetraprenyl-beta-curcumene cyclase
MCGLLRLPDNLVDAYAPMLVRSARYMMSVQNKDGGWGGARGIVSTVEETSLAIDSLAGVLGRISVLDKAGLPVEQLEAVVSGGTNWLMERFADPGSVKPAAIGLYFARLWYYEELYPWIFATAALEKVSNVIIAE